MDVAMSLIARGVPLNIMVPVVIVLNLLSSVYQGVRNWRLVIWPELLRITTFIVVGVIIGLYL